MLMNHLHKFWVVICVLTLVVFASLADDSWNLHGISGDGYYIRVEIGTPAQEFNLLVDTGSSNLAIAGSYYPGIEPYYLPENSSTYIPTEVSVEITYYQGKLTGYLGKDVVRIPSLSYASAIPTDLTIITEAEDFYVNNSHWQGIFGLAFKQIAKPRGIVTPWYDSLVNKTQSKYSSFSLELCGPKPNSVTGEHHGRFSIHTSDSQSSSSLISTPLIKQRFYEVLISQLRIGNILLSLPCSDFNNPRTIIDSGTTNLQLSSNTYYHVVSELKQQMEETTLFLSDDFWFEKQQICFHPAIKPWQMFPNITVFLNHNDESHFGVSIPPQSYLRSVSDSSNATLACLQLGIEHSHVGTVLGAVFLEGLLVVFDRDNKEISFARSECGPDILLLPVENKRDTDSCIYTASKEKGTVIASSIIIVLVMLPLMFAFGKWVHRQVIHQRTQGNVPFINLSDTVN